MRNYYGQSASASATVTVSSNTDGCMFEPWLCGTAGLTASPTSGSAPLNVMFSANTASGCNGGNFSLSYGDGSSEDTPIPADGCNPVITRTHTYTAAGTYTATLYNEMGTRSVIGTATVVVNGGCGSSCGGNFSASPTSGSVPLTVTFSSTISGFHPASTQYVIDYGDGTARAQAANCYSPTDYCISPGINTHTYQSAGTYTARLIRVTYNICPDTGDWVCTMWVSAEETIGSATVTVNGSDPGSGGGSGAYICGYTNNWPNPTPIYCNTQSNWYNYWF